MNLQETIRRILKEESKKDKLIDKYITSLIKPENGKYNHDSKRFDMNGNSGKLNAVIFFNNRNQAMEVMIDENIWEQVLAQSLHIPKRTSQRNLEKNHISNTMRHYSQNQNTNTFLLYQ